MNDLTALDTAFQEMSAQPGSDILQMRYYDRLSDTELFLALDAEPIGEQFEPMLFPFEGENLALAFDTAARMDRFFEGPKPYLAMSGRTLVSLLAAQGFGLAINPDVAPSANVLGAAVVTWMADLHATGAKQTRSFLKAVFPPKAAPEHLVQALDQKLASAPGLADYAILVQQTNSFGPPVLLLAVCGVMDGAEAALTQAVSEVVGFSTIDGLTLDVIFIETHGEIAQRFAKVGLRFDLPKLEQPTPLAPGSDPGKPPILR